MNLIGCIAYQICKLLDFTFHKSFLPFVSFVPFVLNKYVVHQLRTLAAVGAVVG